MTAYLLNRHRMVLHLRNSTGSRSGNSHHLKDVVLLTDSAEARQVLHAGAKLCAYCFPHGKIEDDEP